jgi:hypothetical protein
MTFTVVPGSGSEDIGWELFFPCTEFRFGKPNGFKCIQLTPVRVDPREGVSSII